MAYYLDSVPYNKTTPRKVALPKNSPVNQKMGFDNLVFLFSTSVENSIRVINNRFNCIHDGKYYYYYYNLLYRGKIGSKVYNLKNVNERKEIYDKISDLTPINPHPPGMLDTTPSRNTYFELCKYFEIYKSLTDKLTIVKKIEYFWQYFRSIWNSAQTSQYAYKMVLFDAQMFGAFGSDVNTNVTNPIFVLYYTLYRYFDMIADLDMDFVIFNKGNVLKINPSKCDNKSFTEIRSQLNRLFQKANFANITDDAVDKEIQKENLKTALTDRYNFTGNAESEEVQDLTEDTPKTLTKSEKAKKDLEKKIEQKVAAEIKTAEKDLKDAGVDTSDPGSAEYIKTKASMELDKDKELIEDMYKLMQSEKVPTNPVSSARDAKMRQRQESLTVGSLSFAKINEMNESKHEIPQKDISKAIVNINQNAKKVQFNNYNKEYIEHVMPQDISKVFTSLNDKSMKVYVRDIKIEDTSNELNYKETWHVTLEDEKGQRHTVTVDIPKFLENKFMYLGGNKKIINRQNFLYPVVKTAHDTVQIVTNYNKMFIRRLGTKSIATVERLMKLINTNDEMKEFFTVGNVSIGNRSFLTTIEYDEFAKVISKFKSSDTEIFFSQKDAHDCASEYAIMIPDDKVFIGMRGKKPIFIDSNTQVTEDNESICDVMVKALPENLQKSFASTRSTKKLMYNTATIMSQAIPFIVLLMYWEGFTSVIKKMNLVYRFDTKYPRELKTNEAVIRFKDCFFIYEDSLTIGLLMNGIKVLDTENHNLDEYNNEEPYVEFFKKVYGKTAIMSAIANYYDFMIDPITKEILEDIHLPTDLIELCIYASNLLADESYTPENSQTLSRVRSVEIIPAILYYEISRSYLNYKNSMGKKKISIPRDAVIKQLLSLQTVEDYSTLNPVVELEKDRTITSKGYRGVNVDRSYTEEKRSYDKSMLGVMAINTSPDGNVGITRFLTMEPRIKGVRGYAEIAGKDLTDLKDANLFSPSELLFPLGATRDDSIRTAMASKQSKHVIPVRNATPALMTNGYDESIKYNLSSDFCVCAEEDGTIIDYDEQSKVLMVEYKSGKRKAIDLSSHIVKNGGGGFYLSNELTTNLKVGDKIKKDQTIAWHKMFFTDDKHNGIRMNVGVFEKVAIMSSYDTYNDSTMITHKLARDAESDMVFCKQIVIGKNSNIYDIRKVGDHISIGDPLISFDTSFDDADLNKLLSNLSDKQKSVLEEGSMNQIKSKYAGEIVDIKIYSTVEMDELSESLQKVVGAYYKKIDHKKKFVSSYDTEKSSSLVKCGLMLNETTGKVEPNIYGVVKGQKVQEAVLIEFYISHGDIMGVGDKLT